MSEKISLDSSEGKNKKKVWERIGKIQERG